jgi:GTP pyrophosphokinase
MHETAELGVAAHWSYKQGKSVLDDGTEYRWIRELLDILSHSDNPDEFLENTKLEMYHDQVFCFTPRGDLIALPKDATPVDFAFQLHSDIGYNCTGAKVNGRIVPLKYKLHNGDQVEIIRSKNKAPSPAWEGFVVTGKARSEIRKFIRSSKRSEYISLGKAIIGKYFKKEGFELEEDLLEKKLEKLNKKTLEDLYAEVGEGLIARNDVLKAVHPEHKNIRDKRTKSFFFFNKKGKEIKEDAITIKGLIPGMAVHFAGCCHPLPGDKIVGIVTTGKGVTVHTKDCETLSSFADTPERWIEVSWEQEEGSAAIHVGRLKVLLTHESGSLATLTNEIARGEGNISNLKITHRANDFFELIVDIGVQNVRHLNNIIANLRSRSCVHSVERSLD